MTPRDLVLLGSTGSIGTQAIDVVRRHPTAFRVVGIAAGGGDIGLLASQALEFGVEAVAVSRASQAEDLTLALYADAQSRGWSRGETRLPKVLAGPTAACELAAWPCHTVLNGISGSIGLAPTLAALAAGNTVALANKESLIAGWPLVKAALAGRPERLVPVDSEHSALAQCLRAGQPSEIRRLVLTASGGPFRGRAAADLRDVTPEQALAHPTWTMGPLVTINSATLVNKGLEVIEAHLLFGTPYADIDVVIHPQSIVHSMVEFIDGSTIAQLSPPDMRLAIGLAIGWPQRVPDAAPGMDWTACQSFTFEPLDDDVFPAVALAKAAGNAGGSAPCVFNAANEEAVGAFLERRLPFDRIVGTVETVLDGHHVVEPSTLAEVEALDEWARTRARELTGAKA